MNTVGRFGRRSGWKTATRARHGFFLLQYPRSHLSTLLNMLNQTSRKPTSCYGLTRKPTALRETERELNCVCLYGLCPSETETPISGYTSLRIKALDWPAFALGQYSRTDT